MSLYRILYRSLARSSTDIDEVARIIDHAQTNNKRSGITGMLLTVEDQFMQVLEGEEQAVKGLYKKIATDPRHFNLRLMVEEKIEKRDFPNWQMELRMIESLDSIPEYEDLDLLDEFKDNDGVVFAIMRYFYESGQSTLDGFWLDQK